MTISLGTVPASSTLYVPFNTYDSTGASVTMSGFATSDIKIYKNGSTTERASTSGFTLLDTDGIDFDAITGIHGFSVDLSDNTTAGFYAVGSMYWIVLSSITVNAVTVNLVAATFRIGPAEVTTGYPVVDVGKWLGGTIPAVGVTGVPIVDAKYVSGVSAVGTPGYMPIDWAAMANPTAFANLTNTYILNVTGVSNGVALASGESDNVADALLDRVNGIETGLTPRGLLRLLGSVIAGKVSGAGTTTNTFRNAVADSKARVTATVDTSGNRTAITTDIT